MNLLSRESIVYKQYIQEVNGFLVEKCGDVAGAAGA